VVTPAASLSMVQLPATLAASCYVTFHLVSTVLGNDNSSIIHSQQSHQLDSDDPFVTSNNSDAVASRSRPSLPITQVSDFITFKFILNSYLFRALLLVNILL
jgi:hypothetical protein